jgi:PPOX class probable F420-dependent enzyme
MDIAQALAVIDEQHRAVLATMRADGTPQMSPVVAVPDGRGRLLVSTRQGAMKTRNALKDPRVWLCVMPDEFFGRWVQIEGNAEIVEQPEALDLLVDYYRRAAGEHPDWDEYRTAMIRDKRVVLRIEPTRAGPDRAG